MAVLRPLNGGADLTLTQKITLIGRDPSSDMVITNSKTSWRHAVIVRHDEEYFLEDLDSVNGTYVNDQRIEQRTLLQNGDQIKLFGLHVRFHLESERRPKPAPLPPEQPTSPLGIMSSLDMTTSLRLEVKPEAKLRAILEISRHIHATLDLQEILPKMLECLFSVFPQADHGVILLRDANTGQMTPRASHSRREESDDDLPISWGVINHVVQTSQAILSADAGHDERFDPSQSISRFRIHSFMCVPILSQTSEVLGILQIDTREPGKHFQEADLDVLIIATNQAARSVELAKLHEERRDLEAAVQIQKSFLPNERPDIDELEFFDYYSSAKHVGGDYYDYIPLPGNRLAIALGDVSGKGVSASLLMARLSAAARFALASERDVPEAVRHLSQVLTRHETADRFITFVVMVLDLETFEVVLVNAGHMPPIRIRSDGKEAQVEELGEAIIGLPLAVVDRPYEQMEFQLEPGDRLVLFTDGVTEARNAKGGFFGPERLMETVQTHTGSLEQMGETILNDVRTFAGKRPQSDDLTIVGVGRREASAFSNETEGRARRKKTATEELEIPPLPSGEE